LERADRRDRCLKCFKRSGLKRKRRRIDRHARHGSGGNRYRGRRRLRQVELGRSNYVARHAGNGRGRGVVAVHVDGAADCAFAHDPRCRFQSQTRRCAQSEFLSRVHLEGNGRPANLRNRSDRRRRYRHRGRCCSRRVRSACRDDRTCAARYRHRCRVQTAGGNRSTSRALNRPSH
jgi:hypothetical protein